MALMRNREMGPTQKVVLAKLRGFEDGALRRELVEATALGQEQVISALRGLLKREVVSKTRPEGAHKTAPYRWRVVEADVWAGVTGRPGCV